MATSPGDVISQTDPCTLNPNDPICQQFWSGSATPAASTAAMTLPTWSEMSGWMKIWMGLSVLGTAIGAYHGAKRTGSVGWAIGWGLLGSLAPIIVIPVAFAQGISTPKR